jgi:aquaporin Z
MTEPRPLRRRPDFSLRVRLPWQVLLSEGAGTALLVAIGLSAVIVDFGRGGLVSAWIPSGALRRLLTGFLFGTTGGLIALSPVGRLSGAHINPVVTLAFWLKGTLRAGHACWYVVAQCAGAVVGAVPLLLWGRLGASIDYGVTAPGASFGAGWALAGEVAATALMVALLLVFVGHPRLRGFTPLLFPVLYAVLVWIEAPLSGSSTNPARSLGPSLIANAWPAWWIYWVGPAAGAMLGVALHRVGRLAALEIEVAKLYHFDLDRYGVFHWDRPAGHNC